MYLRFVWVRADFFVCPAWAKEGEHYSESEIFHLDLILVVEYNYCEIFLAIYIIHIPSHQHVVVYSKYFKRHMNVVLLNIWYNLKCIWFQILIIFKTMKIFEILDIYLDISSVTFLFDFISISRNILYLLILSLSFSIFNLKYSSLTERIINLENLK